MKFFLITVLAVAASASFAPLLTVKEKIAGSYIVALKDSKRLSEAVSTIRNNPFFSTLGGRIEREYGTVLNGFSATLSESALNFIRRMDFVEYVEEDGIVRASQLPWGLDRIDKHNRGNAMDGIYAPCGKGNNAVHVYVLDTGIRTSHNDFEGRASADYDVIGGDGSDCNGHGTHCAGTIAGLTYGVAPLVQIHAVRVLNCLGSGSFSGIIDGMNWVADNGVRPAVASMSLGGGRSVSVNRAVGTLHDSGVITVVAAGNDDADACNSSPASAPEAFTVGATDSTDTRAYFSNYGSCVDVFGPGVGVTSAWWTGDDSSKTISGTSMACPHVAGAAAIALGINNQLTPDSIKQEILYYATPNVVNDDMGSANFLLYVGDLQGTD